MRKPAGLGAPPKAGRGSKIGVYGLEGTGKTEFMMSACQVKKLFVVDTEGRTQYYDPEDGRGFEVVYSKDPKDVLDVLAYVEHLHRQGEPVAFGLDSFSSVWFEQQEVAERIGSTSKGTAKFSSWGAAKKPLEKFYAMLFSTPVDVVVTMRAKPAYEAEGNRVESLGWNRPGVERGLPYALDLVVEMRKDELPPGTPLEGKHFYAVVTKTSGPKEGNPLPIGTVVRDPNFAKLAALRLEGSAGLDFAEGVGFQVMMASIASSADLVKWAGSHLGWSKQEAVAHLEEQFGKLTSQRLGKRAEWLYEQANGGHGHKEIEEAVKEAA
jgi:hypothetical protein